MKKSLVLVMALVLVVSFAFADQVGEASLGTEKGVVTAGDPVNVNFSLTVKDSAEDVTTIEVMGDEVADNVFVMLIKDKPNDAQYEAKKVQDPDAKKTTYYIKAQELQGQNVKVYAELIDWKNETVMSDEATFNWKENTVAKNLQLTPPEEGLYTVKAYIEFGDGTRMELKGWGGYAQLVALDNYVKETVPGLTAELQDDDGAALEYGAANTLTVNAGVEFMYAKASEDSNATDSSYLGVYGEGSETSPNLVWTYSANGKPEFADVELVYSVNDSNPYDADPNVDQDTAGIQKGTDTDTAYIKFKVMQESFEEGDCCATAGDPKWALWFAIGTGEFHTYSNYLYQAFEFHVLGATNYISNSWTVVKGAECRGWVKAIFYLDPSDVEIWLYAILGTDYYANVAGETVGPVSGEYGETDTLNASYTMNFLDYAELNLIVETKIKDVLTLNFGALDIPVTKNPDTTVKGFAAGNVELAGDVATIDLGGQVFFSDIASMTEYDYTAHMFLSGLDVDLKDFLMESLNNVRFGVTLDGSNDGLDSVGMVACLEPGPVCCVPSFKLGMNMAYDPDDKFSMNRVYATYGHSLGTYGPVDLEGTLGVIYSMGSAAVDSGDYGLGQYSGDAAGYDWALGVGYEVTGTMTW